ncbi:MAG: hypothetical protein JWL66_1644 [Sphingomonadales bacterium]|nr:hypothetical protein [Sphingomonadales bacterium]
MVKNSTDVLFSSVAKSGLRIGSAKSIEHLVPWVIAVIAISFLYFGRAVLVPITLAILLSFLLAPIVSVLRKLKMGRHLSVIVAILLALGTITITSAVIISQAGRLTKDAPAYAEGIAMHVNDAITALRAYYLALTGRTHLSESLLGATKGVTDTQPRATRFWRERLLIGIAAALNESAHGHHAQAQAIADAILADSQQDGRMVAVAEAHLVRAFVLARCPTGQTQALAPLVAGLNLIGMHAIPGLLHEWRELVKDHAEALRGLLDPAAHVLLERIEREWGGRVQKDLLSDREVSVLRGVAAGLTNKHISRECGLSVNTIKFHLKQCFRKLDVQTREGAVETARQAGLF